MFSLFYNQLSNYFTNQSIQHVHKEVKRYDECDVLVCCDYQRINMIL